MKICFLLLTNDTLINLNQFIKLINALPVDKLFEILIRFSHQLQNHLILILVTNIEIALVFKWHVIAFCHFHFSAVLHDTWFCTLTNRFYDYLLFQNVLFRIYLFTFLLFLTFFILINLRLSLLAVFFKFLIDIYINLLYVILS